MVRVETLHTSAVSPPALERVRALLVDVFDGDFDDHAWEHALGGMHVILWDGEELIGHGAVIQRRVLHGERALRCGYVEAIGVRPDRRRQGHGRTIMQEVGGIVAGAYDLGALGASDDGAPLYRAFGWQSWDGETAALTPAGVVPTTDQTTGSLMVLPVAVELDPSASLTCDWREGHVW